MESRRLRGCLLMLVVDVVLVVSLVAIVFMVYK